jgi:hypothetical protein
MALAIYCALERCVFFVTHVKGTTSPTKEKALETCLYYPLSNISILGRAFFPKLFNGFGTIQGPIMLPI